MAKGKVHKIDVQATDTTLGDLALCRQRHRRMLPLLLTDAWDAVTCARCLTHRPAPAQSWVGARLARLMSWFRGGR